MPRIVQWLNENSYRAYPFVEDSNRNCGSKVLPDNALLDFQLLEFEADPAFVYLHSIAVVGDLIDFEFRYGTTTRVLTVSVAAPTHTPINYGTAEPYRITAIFGPGLEEIANWGDGTYDFVAPPAIEPALHNFENKHRVTLVQSLDENSNAELSGVIHVREGYNCKVNIVPANDLVIVSAQHGAGRGISCESEEEDISLCGDVLLRINGLVADSEGNFQFFAGPGVSVMANAEGHEVIFKSALKDSDNTRCG